MDNNKNITLKDILSGVLNDGLFIIDKPSNILVIIKHMTIHIKDIINGNIGLVVRYIII